MNDALIFSPEDFTNIEKSTRITDFVTQESQIREICDAIDESGVAAFRHFASATGEKQADITRMVESNSTESRARKVWTPYQHRERATAANIMEVLKEINNHKALGFICRYLADYVQMQTGVPVASSVLHDNDMVKASKEKRDKQHKLKQLEDYENQNRWIIHKSKWRRAASIEMEEQKQNEMKSIVEREVKSGSQYLSERIAQWEHVLHDTKPDVFFSSDSRWKKFTDSIPGNAWRKLGDPFQIRVSTLDQYEKVGNQNIDFQPAKQMVQDWMSSSETCNMFKLISILRQVGLAFSIHNIIDMLEGKDDKK